MITAGCDVGSLTSKAVVIRDGRIIGSAIIRSSSRPEISAQKVMDEALEKAKISQSDVEYCVGTGYGRDNIPFVDLARSEIACHARGAVWLAPATKTIIDIGGQDCKAIRLDKNGRVEKFLTNDKCAAGTGRFLEVMAKLLGVSVDDLGKMSKKSREPVTLASTCTVWAQADVIQYVNSGIPLEDVGAGVNNAMAGRVATLANAVHAQREVAMTGGVAKNAGVVKSLEKLIGHKVTIIRKADPQLAGAIGAAVLASDVKEGRA
ncbi:CoA-substrate-specific enzyme activase [Desulfatibacillum aliphaticivorans]|uniref:CoA-substrate-specific enzyme activase n=1 Tax=Desulfatibacillum aliphaticivorans TaxID=218208 RepID=B8FDE2_DESAL|nr:acyl-CoA dehydratase activase [Desulfatibacillum aliphaticivorans]ACL06573.1 CoA-substrate-specific enzyme activase [Desulfatibacillum aliphaticivorans]